MGSTDLSWEGRRRSVSGSCGACWMRRRRDLGIPRRRMAEAALARAEGCRISVRMVCGLPLCGPGLLRMLARLVDA